MPTKKIVVLGGSSASTPHFVEVAQRQLRGASDLAEGIQIVLIGRNSEKLAAVTRACQALVPTLDVTWDDVLERGVEGAAIILNQVRVGGLEGRAWDEQAPTTLGLLGEETMGAGGFALGYRTLPVIRSLARMIERHAPDSWFVNLTNPANLVVSALAAETRIRALSICDIPVALERSLRAVARDDEQVSEVRVFGTNHVSAIVCARNAAGHDLLPQLLPKVAAASHGKPFDTETLTTFGFLPSPYLRFIFSPEEYTPTDPVRRSRADELLELQDQLLTSYATGQTEHARALLSVRNPHWYEEVVMPVIASLLSPATADTTHSALGRQQFIVQIPNRGLVPFVSEHAAVETSVEIVDGVITPLVAPSIPPEIKQLTMQITESDELIRMSTLDGNNPDLAIRALALNPLVPNLRQAREFWRLFSTRWLD